MIPNPNDCRKIIGMDLSLSSPAAVVLHRNPFQTCAAPPLSATVAGVSFATETKKIADKYGAWRFEPSSKTLSKSTEAYRLERINFLLGKFAGMIDRTRPDVVAIEDYGVNKMGASFYVIEFTGLLKRWLFLRGIPMRLYAPQYLKEFAYGKGNANKREMEEACQKKFGAALSEVIDLDDVGKAKSDIFDAGACAYLLDAELSAKANPQRKEDYPALLFRRGRKENSPPCLLEMPFVVRGQEVSQ